MIKRMSKKFFALFLTLTMVISLLPALTIPASAAEGDKWATQTSGVVANLKGVCYGGSTFVAVGAGGTIITSSNGTSWTNRTTANSAVTGGADLNAICYGNSMFMAVGAGGKVITSADGATWTAHTNTITNNLVAVAYGLCGSSNTFVAVDSDGNLFTSTDGGTVWTKTFSYITYILGICYGNGQFVVVGDFWAPPLASDVCSIIMTSSDGVTWTDRSSINSAQAINSVCYGNSQYVACDIQSYVFTSSTGTSWTYQSRLYTDSIKSLDAICYGGITYVTVGTSGILYISTNGTSWSAKTSGTPNNLCGVCYGNGTFVAVGAGGAITASVGIVKPAITGVSPAKGLPTGSTSVTITGTNLGSATEVKFGDTAGTITANTSTSITATSPSGSEGAVDITVTTAGGTSDICSADQFTYDGTAPAVSSVAVPTNGTYKTGAALSFTVNYNEDVAVTGTPTLALTLNTGGTVYASYVSGSSTSKALVFRYTIVSGNSDADGITVGLSLSDGTIKDIAGNSADLTLKNVGVTSGVKVDAVAPSISSVAAPSDGTYVAAQNLDYTVSFNEAVNVVVTGGTPYLTLTIGSKSVHAAYQSGSGTSVLTFRYTVISGETDTDGVELGSNVTLNVGTITDSAGNSANLSFTGSTAAGVKVDTTAPSVSSINRSSPTSETTNQTSVTYRVTFSEDVKNVDKPDFTLTATGTAAGTIASVVGVAGHENSLYDVVVNSITGSGSLRLDLNSSLTGITDNSTNAIFGGYTAGQAYTFDTSSPTVSSINRSSPSTEKTNLTSVIYQVTFSEPVTGVDTSAFTLTTTDTATGTISAVSAVNSSTYNVTVNTISGAGTLRLDLKSSGTGITDIATNAISGGYNGGQVYKIDLTAPTILSASRTDNTHITVTLSEACQSLAKENDGGFIVKKTGSATAYAVSGTAAGGDALHVVLTVADMGTTAGTGVTVTYATGGNGTITDMAGNALASDSTGKTISAWDTAAPTVISINRSSPSAEATNQTTLTYRVTFSEPVTGVDVSDFEVTTTYSATGTVSAVSAISSSIYDVTVNTVSGLGNLYFCLKGSGTDIKDIGGTAIAPGFVNGPSYFIDTYAPTIASILPPANGTYVAGQDMDFAVIFSEAVSVNTDSGTPYLALTVGSSTVHAVYQSCSGSTLFFRYTVVSGNADANGVDILGSITLNGGTIKDSAGNDAATTYGSFNAAHVLVDAVSPTISGVTGPSPETYSIGDELNFTATFSETVNVTGSPYIRLVMGSSTVDAAYVSGSGTTAIKFRYTIISDNVDSDGIVLSSTISLNGGTIKDTAGNNASLSFTPPATSGVIVDGIVPTINVVTGPSSGTYVIGEELNFTATFSKTVNVTGAPYIVLTIGSSTVNAAYASGSGTPSLTFTYTVVSGNADTDGIVYASPITLPTGAAIKDAAGNDLETRTFTPPTTSGVIVDGIAPAISSAEIASDNSYIDIVFSKGVYGSSHGATALTASKLQIIFTKNSGAVTSVTISSIKKNDNSSEASASALTGGEATVRAFLNITGSPSGTETIEIKPANASSVYDINGNSMESAQTTGVKKLHAPVSYGGDSSDNGGAEVIVNGESQTAGTSRTTTSPSGQTTTTVTVDTDKLKTILDSQSSGATVTIPISGNSEVAAGTLTGAMVRSMEDKAATLVIQTSSGTYTLPAAEINISAVSEQLGSEVSLSDINVSVRISEPSASMTQVVESAAQDGGFTIMVPAVDYTITCTHGSQTVNVSSFNSYVERTIAVPEGVDPTKITTGVVVDSDGTVHHVPTRVTLIGGKYYAVINSLTNSTYSVIYNPVTFTDITGHWAKDAINDMGSRMVVTGMGNGTYEPDRNMTRAEFAAITVRALGLEPGSGASGFGDVAASDWYSGYIKAAAAYGVIKGYDSGNFGPNDTITREQAMTMIARAMRITGLTTDSPDISKILASYADGASISAYAEESIVACIDTGIVSGRGSGTIAPKASITRAEVAVMVSRLLQKSKLI